MAGSGASPVSIRESCRDTTGRTLTFFKSTDRVIVDGTLIPTGRIAADQPYYSQKHKQHGMNVQVVARPDGTPLWFSRAAPRFRGPW